MLTWPTRKNIDETLDYYFDFSPAVEPACPGDANAPETIVSIVATVMTGMAVIVDQELYGSVLQLFVSGGVAGEVATIEAVMITSKGRTYTDTARLRVGS